MRSRIWRHATPTRGLAAFLCIVAAICSASAALAAPIVIDPTYSGRLLAGVLDRPANGLVYRPATHDLIVVVVGESRVVRVDAQTGAVSTFASVPSPDELAIDSNGNVYVKQHPNGPIHRFNSAGQPLSPATFPAPSHCTPTGTAFDSADNFYLACVFSPIYRYAAGTTSNPGVYADGIPSLEGIGFNAADYMFAVDFGNGAIYQVTPGGMTKGSHIAWATNLDNSTSPTLNVAFHPLTGELFASNGSTVVRVPVPGTVMNFVVSFQSTADLDFDRLGCLYVDDFKFGQIWKFCPKGPATLVLEPKTDVNTAGQQHCVTATVRDALRNEPVEDVSVHVTVSGANTASGTLTTDENGRGTFCYTGTRVGADTIVAVAEGGSNPRDAATKMYHAGPPAALSLVPKSDTNRAGEQHCVTATVTDDHGNPVSGAPVEFSVSGANIATGTVPTGPDGTATFCYAGTRVGEDTIRAEAHGGREPRDQVTKTYLVGSPARLMLEPKAATNEVDAEHCVTATVTDLFGNPTPGITVRFSTAPPASPSSGSIATDAAGRATFCFTSAVPRVVTILGYADTDGDGTQDANEPFALAVKTFVLPPLDHFQCYDAKPLGGDDDDDDGGQSRRIVSLEDQFGVGKAYVDSTELLCNPADKNGEGINQPLFHLLSYGIKPINRTFTTRRVEVQNQFGTLTLTVRKPDTLLVPSSKSIAPAQPGLAPFMRGDHFQCYRTDGGDDDDDDGGGNDFAARSVLLRDQFGTTTVKVTRPIALCNPVNKNSEGLLSPKEHLTCYAIKPGAFAKRTVLARNQFGLETLTVPRPHSLCVPSTTRELPTPPDDEDDDD